MELCLMIEGQEGVSWSQWVDLARACEEHGIPALLRSDHLMNLDGEHPRRGALDAWGTICALGAVTSKLRLGTMVSPTSFRHPSILGKLVTTADHITGGRVELGLGAGWHQREHEAYGLTYEPTKVRMDVLGEQLQVLMDTWGDESFDFEGRHYTLRNLDAHPKPVQSPHPPLILGGTAGPRSAALAAKYADEYNTVFPTVEDVRRRKAVIDHACEQAGRQPIPLSIMTGVLVGEDEEDLRRRTERLRERTGRDASEPPEGWVVGTVEQAAEQLRELAQAGVTRVMCQQLLHDDLEHVALLGERVAPQLRR